MGSFANGRFAQSGADESRHGRGEPRTEARRRSEADLAVVQAIDDDELEARLYPSVVAARVLEWTDVDFVTSKIRVARAWDYEPGWLKEEFKDLIGRFVGGALKPIKTVVMRPPIRLGDEGREILEKLQKLTGLDSAAAIIRLAIREALASREQKRRK